MDDIPKGFWHHKIQLKDGRFTPGEKLVSKDKHLMKKIDFKEKSVLDMGCNDGYFTVLASLSGAKKVTAVDIGFKENFLYIMNHFEVLNFEHIHSSIYDFYPTEHFDVVLCFGLYYHLSDPVTALIKCFNLAKDIVCIEGVIHIDHKPSAILLDPFEINAKDPSNIFSLSLPFLEKIAKLNGFSKIDQDYEGFEPVNGNFGRASVLFKRVDDGKTIYPNCCYPKPPLSI